MDEKLIYYFAWPNVSSHCLQKENNRLLEVCTKFVMS